MDCQQSGNLACADFLVSLSPFSLDWVGLGEWDS